MIYVSPSLWREMVVDRQTTSIAAVMHQVVTEYGIPKFEAWFGQKVQESKHWPESEHDYMLHLAKKLVPRIIQKAAHDELNVRYTKAVSLPSDGLCPVCHRMYKLHGACPELPDLTIICEAPGFAKLTHVPTKRKSR